MTEEYKKEKMKDWCLYILLILVFLLGAGTVVTYAGALDRWEPVNPLPTGNDLNDIVYGNGIYVAAGDSGTILTSGNGIDWKLRNTGIRANLKRIVFASNQFVVVGGDGVILTSNNGVGWTARESGTDAFLSAVTYGNGQFVAAGEDGIVLTSLTAKTWTRRYTHETIDFSNVAYGNGIYLAVGRNGMMSSVNGIGWRKISCDTISFWKYLDFQNTAYGNGTWIASSSSSIYYSTDNAETWTQADYNTTNSDLHYINSKFVGIGRNAWVETSMDGQNWTSKYISNVQRYFFGVTYGHAGYIVVGEAGTVYRSPDLSDWTMVTEPKNWGLWGIAFGSGTFVAMGNSGNVLTSSNGVDWVARSTGNSYAINDIVFGNSMFAAVGSRGTILTSPDGIAWTQRHYDYLKTYTHVVYGNGVFLANGNNGTRSTSTDGMNWTTVNLGFGNTFYAVCFADSMFVASSSTRFYYSVDGVNWTEGKSHSYGNVRHIIHDGSKFYAFHRYGGSSMFTSADGIDWTLHQMSGRIDFNQVCYGNGTFLGVEDDGRLFSSLDGINWREHGLGTVQDMYGCMYHDHRFYAVGRNEMILRSDRFQSICGNAGAAGVEMVVENDRAGSVITGNDGSYCVYVSPGWSGRIWPRLTGYRFTPVSRSYTWVMRNLYNQNYALKGDTVILSGTVTDGINPLPNVTVAFSHNNYKTVTDASGGYSYTVPYGITTTVTPSLAAYSFFPGQYSYDELRADKTGQDFTGTYIPGEVLVISNPADGGTVSGTVIVTAELLSPDVTINEVDFYIDGEKVKDDTSAPYQYRWETNAVENGSYTIAIEGVDDSDNIYQHQVAVTVDNDTVAAAITVGRDRLNFGMIPGGTSTGPQTVSIGGGTLSWQATSDRSWIDVMPSGGSGDGTITVSVNGAGLGAGSYSGTVTASATGESVPPAVVNVFLEVIEPSMENAPIGTFEAPLNGAAVQGSIPVTGWALDDIEVTGVKIFRGPAVGESTDLIFVGDAVLVEDARPDVEKQYGYYPKSYRGGWGYMMLTNGLPNGGNGTFTITAKAFDGTDHETVLGTRTITVDNKNAVKPFGALDSPGPGEEISGTEYKNWGWALTPQPNTIPVDGSTITVWVDGKKLPGHPVYNISRTDIADLFPGYNNSSGPAGFFLIDTTLYEDGVHTISWTVADDAGNTEGIGSRFFKIRNVGNGNRSKRTWRRVPDIDNSNRLISSGPIRVLRGFDETNPGKPGNTGMVLPDRTGRYRVEIKQGERVEIHLNGYVPYSVPGSGGRLPAGSTFDAKDGIFYWMPGAAFLGDYDFRFVECGVAATGKMIKLTVMIHRK